MKDYYENYLQFLQYFIHEVAGILFIVHGSLDHISKHLLSEQDEAWLYFIWLDLEMNRNQSYSIYSKIL